MFNSIHEKPTSTLGRREEGTPFLQKRFTENTIHMYIQRFFLDNTCIFYLWKTNGFMYYTTLKLLLFSEFSCIFEFKILISYRILYFNFYVAQYYAIQTWCKSSRVCSSNWSITDVTRLSQSCVLPLVSGKQIFHVWWIWQKTAFQKHMHVCTLNLRCIKHYNTFCKTDFYHIIKASLIWPHLNLCLSL